MSGKRLLDALALLNAARAVAAQHISIRQSQFQLFAKTHILTKCAANRQSSLAQGAFNASQPFSQSAAGSSRRQVSWVQEMRNEVFRQDHHYERSEANSVTDTIPAENLEVRQERARRHPLADGTIPPGNSEIVQEYLDTEAFSRKSDGETAKALIDGKPGARGDLDTESLRASIPDPEEKKKEQRLLEFQIPSKTAEPPTMNNENIPEFGVEQEKDLFYQPPGTNSPVLSALPRIKLPKQTEDIQGGDPHVPENINADVFYSSTKISQRDLTKQNELVHEDLDGEVIGQLFHSPRVSGLFWGKSRQMPGGAKFHGSRAFTTGAFWFQGRSKSDQEGIERLAVEIMKDANSRKPVSQN